jgi:MFS family permease
MRLRRTWSIRTSFWLVIAAQVVLFAGSNLPTPLFPLYEQQYGFGSATVTLLFGIYVATLVPTLLLLGPVADRIGRRPLLAGGIGLTVASSAAFLGAQGLGWLVAGEVIYGLGSAMVMSCVAAAIRELHPGEDVGKSALAASVAAAGGLTIGPLVSGLLASATPWPTVSPFLVDIVVATVLAVGLLRIPETRPRAGPRPTMTSTCSSIRSVPADIRRAFAVTAVAGAASFSVVGWVFGLAPSYLHEELNVLITQPVVAGLFAALFMLTNGTTQLLLRRRHSATTMRTALVGVIVGMGIMAGSGAASSLAVAIVGAMIAGASTGVAQMNAMATIQGLAPVHARARVTSGYFTVCYLGLSVPVILAGAAAERFGLATATAWFFVSVTVLVGAAIGFQGRVDMTRSSDSGHVVELPVERAAQPAPSA